MRAAHSPQSITLFSSRSIHPSTHVLIHSQQSPPHWDTGLGRILCKEKNQRGKAGRDKRIVKEVGEEEYGKERSQRETRTESERVTHREVRLPVLDIVWLCVPGCLLCLLLSLHFPHYVHLSGHAKLAGENIAQCGPKTPCRQATSCWPLTADRCTSCMLEATDWAGLCECVSVCVTLPCQPARAADYWRSSGTSHFILLSCHPSNTSAPCLLPSSSSPPPSASTSLSIPSLAFLFST